jgi:hypothetical protein
MSGVSVNGTAATSLGFYMSEPANWRDAQLRYSSVVIPKRPGTWITESDPDEPAQEITLRGVVKGTSRSDAWTKWDVLVATCSETPTSTVQDDFATLRFDTAPTREKLVKLTGVTNPAQPAVLSTGTWVLNVALTFTAFYPHWRDSSDQTVSGIVNSDTAIPLGTAPTRPRLTITGAATNPTITYKAFDTTEIQALGLTASLAGGETLTVDLDALTLTSSGPAVTLTSGRFFVLDAIKHGHYGASQWPTLRVSSGTMVCTYRRAWRG